MSEAKRVAKSVIVIIIFSLGSKLLGFIREVLIAAKFGSGMETDTFFVAITATGLITTLIGTSINTTMIPVLSEIESKEGKSGKIEHSNNILNILFFVSLVFVFAGWIVAPLVIKILASGFKGGQFDLAVLLMRIGLPVMFFSCTLYVFRGFLQSELMFTESAASNFPFNFVYIFFLLFLSGIYGIKGLMAANVLAVASQIAIQIPGIRKAGFKYKLYLDFKDKYIRKMLHLVPPVIFGVAVNDLNAIVDRTLASNLVTGSISALNYASRLNNLILGVFISAITTVLFPMLSKESNKDGYDDMKKIMGYGINTILLITIPATVGLIILSTPIVQIAFERGAFDKTATVMTSQALVFYSVGLAAMAVSTLLTRVYYSLQDTKSPMFFGVVSVTVNIILNLILIKFMAHSGLALATSIAAIIATILMLFKLKRKIGALGTVRYIKCGVKAGIASAIMGAASYAVYQGMSKTLDRGNVYSLISLLAAVGIGMVVYLILCYLFRVEEIRIVIGKVKQRLMRRIRY